MRVFDSFNKEVYLFSQAGDDVDLSLMGWDGTMPSGVGAPNGVYYYTIQLQGETENHNQLLQRYFFFHSIPRLRRGSFRNTLPVRLS